MTSPPPPSNIPEPPPYPGTEVDAGDNEFEDDIRCYVLYDFQGTVHGKFIIDMGLNDHRQ